MRSHFCGSLVCLGLVSLASQALAQEKAQEKKPSFPTNEQMRHFRALANPKLSPDGKHVLLQVTDSTTDGAKSHIWLIDIDGGVDGGGSRQLTFSPDSDRMGERSADWMPDGQSIVFEAHRGDHTSLYRLPMNGGEAKPFELKVTPLVDESKVPDFVPPPKGEVKKDDKAEPIAVDAGGYKISPDGKSITLVIEDPETPGEKRGKDAKADANWVNHNEHRERLYIMDVATGKLTLVGMPATVNVRNAIWSDDSQRLLAMADAPNGASDLGPSGSVWLIHTNDLAHPTDIGMVPTVGGLAWGKDDTLLYTATSKIDAPPGYDDLYTRTLARDGAVHDLTDGFAGSIGRGEPTLLKDGSILEILDQGFDTMPAVFKPGATKPEIVKLPVATLSALDTNEAQNGWVFLGGDGAHPTALYYMAALGATPKMLSAPKLTTDDLLTVAAKRIEWKSDQFTIQGTLYLPPDAGSKKVPLIVEVHGGPLGSYTDNYAPFTSFLVGHGWAVLHVNPRGSTGRGAAFAAANHNDLGGGDYRDIMAGVDFVLKTESIDPDKTALMGYSYGGEMAGFVEGKTTRFKAIVSCAPVIDQQSEYGTEGGSWYDRWYYGKPWEHEADAWRQSPLSGAAKAKTPFMLIQGEADTTDPLGQSKEMYRALRQEGVPVELVTYPRDNHGPLGSAIYGSPVRETWHGFDARQRIVAFFQKAFGEPAK